MRKSTRTHTLRVAGAVAGMAVLSSAAVAASGTLFDGHSVAARGVSATVSPKIVGGQPADQPYPFAVSMQIDKNGDPNWHTCAGSLVTHQWVVTAAHCVVDENNKPKDPALYHVRLGTNDRYQGGTTAKIAKIVVFPTYDGNAKPDPAKVYGDVAVFKLDKPVGVEPIRMAAKSPAVGTKVRAIGWGRTTADNTGPLPTEIRQLDTTILAPEKCFGGDYGIGKGDLCFDTPGPNGTCGGDSGGPLIRKVGREWQLIAANSRGMTDACGDGLDVNTDVAFHSKWIKEQIAGG
jgi:secreted trypsin-like serine protease